MMQQPVGWQYRFKHGDWSSWINIPVALDDFRRIQKDSLKKGTVEMRPIYLAASPFATEDMQNIHSHLSDAAANPGSRENLLAIIEINRDALGALLEGK